MNIRKLAPGSDEFDIPPLGVIYPGEYHIFLVSDKGVPSISLRGIVSAASGGKGKVDDAKAAVMVRSISHLSLSFALRFSSFLSSVGLALKLLFELRRSGLAAQGYPWWQC